MSWQVIWGDGSLSQASSPSALLDGLAQMQYGTRPVRDMLADRVLCAFDVLVDTTLPDGEFIKALSGAGLFMLVDDTDAKAGV